jgi:thioredoxin-dependent peroxiredoxin
MFLTTLRAILTGLVRTAVAPRGEPPVDLRPGDLAPPFALEGSDREIYRLADFLDRRQAVVLAWFPKAFTGGCTAQCKSLAASTTELDRFNVRYVAASVDRPEVNRRFADALGLGFPILSDPDGTVARAYGVLRPSGFATRWTFYIGADGRILDVDRRVTPAHSGPAVAARLAELGIPRHDAARSLSHDRPT